LRGRLQRISGALPAAEEAFDPVPDKITFMAPRTPPFAGAGIPFSDFLARTGKAASMGDRRFLARNFLLDEGVMETRLDSYARAGASGDHADVSAWADRHENYLRNFVSLNQPASGAPETVNPAHPSCPETFRHPEAFRSLGAAHPGLDLVRVVSVGSMVRRLPTGTVTESELLSWAQGALATKNPDSLDWQSLEAALAEWNPRLDLRPVFAGFWQEQRDLLEGGPSDWADVLRDRLGLLHLSPRRPGQELPIFVFCYPIRRIPRRLGLRDERALAVPTVLDGQLSEAFCPAPVEDAYGRVVDLGASYRDPSREVLHPYFPVEVKFLARVGVIRRAPVKLLKEARAAHLLAIRVMSGRDNYAAATDGDLA
jgi:hypothetical protein